MLPAYRYLASPDRARARTAAPPRAADHRRVEPRLPSRHRGGHRCAAAALPSQARRRRRRRLLLHRQGARQPRRARSSARSPSSASAPAPSSARLAVRLVQDGWNLILFPEGGRSPDGWLQEMKPGAAFVAAKAQRPLVPMWITGTEHLLPEGCEGTAHADASTSSSATRCSRSPARTRASSTRASRTRSSGSGPKR